MKKSCQSVRLTALPENRTLEQIKTQACRGLKAERRDRNYFDRIFFRRPNSNATASDDLLGTGLAKQKRYKTATVTFTTPKAKENALKSEKKRLEKAREGGYIDDDFRGITTLYSGRNEAATDLDVCAVHGLNGHAFDTWTSKTRMWLRDHLPQQPAFENSRIMTYGYNSQLLNGKGTQSRFEDFADQLLVLLGQERTTPEERARPILFLCHSMGGLIVRLAMVRYEKYPQLHPGVNLGHRGLVLLSTPNAGSMVAQWSDLTLALGGVLGLQSSLIQELRVLDPRQIDAVNDWATLQYRPLIRCYCESSPTVVAPGFPGGTRQIITAASAGFLEDTAMQLPETDHHSVCKFEESTGPAFDLMMGGLCSMRAELISNTGRIAPGAANAKRTGRPEPTAPSYPLSKPFIFNHGFRKLSGNFVKRPQLLGTAMKVLNETMPSQGVLVLTGMAGCGKTELLLDYVKQKCPENSVAILSAASHVALRTKLEEYALMFGHDVIRNGPNDPRSLDVWKSFTPQVQANYFLGWAATAENKCIIILDELDDIKHASDIARDLPDTARAIVSTRNPAVSKQLTQSGFSCLDLSVSVMEFHEAETLLTSLTALTTVSLSLEQRSRLVEGLGRHPFAMCAASSYLPVLQRIQDPSEHYTAVEVLLNALEGDNFQERQEFFDYDGLWNLSVSKLFGTAMAHMRRETTDVDFDSEIRPLLQAIAFLSDPQNDCHFTTFFNDTKFLAGKRTPQQHAVDQIFVQGLNKHKKTLDKALQSSLVIDLYGKTHMPALWRDCIMLYESDPPKDRKYWLNQILQLCRIHSQEGNDNHKLYPFVKNCKRIAKRYAISLQDMVICPNHRAWLENVLRRDSGIASGTETARFASLLAECQEAEATRAHRTGPEWNATYARLAKQYSHLKDGQSRQHAPPTMQDSMCEIEKIIKRAARELGNPVWGWPISIPTLTDAM